MTSFGPNTNTAKSRQTDKDGTDETEAPPVSPSLSARRRQKEKRKTYSHEHHPPDTDHLPPPPPPNNKKTHKKKTNPKKRCDETQRPPPETPSPAWLCTRQVQEEATGSASVRCQSLRPTERQRAPNSVPGEEEGGVGGGLGWGGFL